MYELQVTSWGYKYTYKYKYAYKFHVMRWGGFELQVATSESEVVSSNQFVLELPSPVPWNIPSLTTPEPRQRGYSGEDIKYEVVKNDHTHIFACATSMWYGVERL